MISDLFLFLKVYNYFTHLFYNFPLTTAGCLNNIAYTYIYIYIYIVVVVVVDKISLLTVEKKFHVLNQ